MSHLQHRMRFLAAALLVVLSACIPLSHGRVYARKMVAVAVDTTLLVAKDASTCRRNVPRRVRPGQRVLCVWHEPRSAPARP